MMSTKIYTAWCIPATQLNKFLDLFDEGALRLIAIQARWLMRRVRTEDVDAKFSEWKKANPGLKDTKAVRWRIRFFICDDRIWLGDRKNADINPFVYQVGVNVWVHKEHAYIIPWGTPKLYEKIKFPEWVKDFAYWDNVDPPESVSPDEWGYREKVWDAVCLKEVEWWNRRRLVHHAMDMGTDYSHAIQKLKKLVGAAALDRGC